MRNLEVKMLASLSLTVVFSALFAGNSFAQQAFRISTASKSPCALDSGNALTSTDQRETVTQSGNAEVLLQLASSSRELQRCGFFSLAVPRDKDRDSTERPRVSGFLSFESTPGKHSGDATKAADESSAKQGPPQGAPDTAAEAQELAKKLSNPVASLISLPLQSNFDFGMGTGSGWRFTLNVQPVIPIKLNDKWNLISRTIVPIIHQSNVTGPGTSQSGLGDTTQSLFFSPNKTVPFIWAIGPVILIPTATDANLGTQKLGFGPTALVLKQKEGWTYGILANHIWSVAGKSTRSRVSSTFLQPFLSYTTKRAWTYAINTESTYDWVSGNWSVPINPLLSKLVRFGHQPMSFGGGVKCWATVPTGGPRNCSLRIVVTALFPKKK